MKVIVGFPPNFQLLKRHFSLTGRKVIYAWGDTLFNPQRVQLWPSIMAHEKVHGERQKAIGIVEWWNRYMDDPAFALAEEILAHQAEYQAGAHNPGHLEFVATKLTSPIYNFKLTLVDAKAHILKGGGSDVEERKGEEVLETGDLPPSKEVTVGLRGSTAHSKRTGVGP